MVRGLTVSKVIIRGSPSQIKPTRSARSAHRSSTWNCRRYLEKYCETEIAAKESANDQRRKHEFSKTISGSKGRI
jgi:hypothetical protein